MTARRKGETLVEGTVNHGERLAQIVQAVLQHVEAAASHAALAYAKHIQGFDGAVRFYHHVGHGSVAKGVEFRFSSHQQTKQIRKQRDLDLGIVVIEPFVEYWNQIIGYRGAPAGDDLIADIERFLRERGGEGTQRP